MKWCAQLSVDFLNFRNFYRHFSEFVAPPTNENENYVLHLKEQPLLKSAENLVEIGL